MTWNLSGSTLSTMNTLYTPRILTGILYNPRTIRQQMTQIMFQKVNIPAIFIVNRAVLALLFIALTTGIALHSRYSVSHAVPQPISSIHFHYDIKSRRSWFEWSFWTITTTEKKSSGTSRRNCATLFWIMNQRWLVLLYYRIRQKCMHFPTVSL